jgi:hypothetical protein
VESGGNPVFRYIRRETDSDHSAAINPLRYENNQSAADAMKIASAVKAITPAAMSAACHSDMFRIPANPAKGYVIRYKLKDCKSYF